MVDESKIRRGQIQRHCSKQFRNNFFDNGHFRCSTCVLVCFSCLLDHMVYLKLRREDLFGNAEQLHKLTLKIVLDEQSCRFE